MREFQGQVIGKTCILDAWNAAQARLNAIENQLQLKGGEIQALSAVIVFVSQFQR
jgi:hypothetical protein